MAGIVQIEKYLPALRISAEEFKKAWRHVGAGFKEKRVMDIDEDCITMGIAAGRSLLDKCDVTPTSIDFLALASANYPYSEKVMASTLVESLEMSSECFTSEHGNSSIAGTAAFLEAWRYSSLYPGHMSIVIASDAPQGMLKEPAENSYGAGAAAIAIGEGAAICEIAGAASAIAEFIGERFRPAGDTNVRNMGIEAYSREASETVITKAIYSLFWRTGHSATNYKYAVFNNHNLKTVSSIVGKLGFLEGQIKTGNTFGYTGDTGAAAPFLGLYDALILAEPGERILLCSYGGGSASHAISLLVTERITGWQKSRPIKEDNAKYISYIDYMKYKGIIL